MATVTVPWKTQARLSCLAATARRFLSLFIVRSISLLRRRQSAPEGPSPSSGRCCRGVRLSPSLAAASCVLRRRVGGRERRWFHARHGLGDAACRVGVGLDGPQDPVPRGGRTTGRTPRVGGAEPGATGVVRAVRHRPGPKRQTGQETPLPVIGPRLLQPRGRRRAPPGQHPPGRRRRRQRLTGGGPDARGHPAAPGPARNA